jgi:hypothetical protein
MAPFSYRFGKATERKDSNRRASGDLTGPCANTFANPRAMDRNIGVDLEARVHAHTSNIERRDLEQAIQAASPADDQ